MKQRLAALVLFAAAALSAHAEKPNPTDFKTVVHVLGSAAVYAGSTSITNKLIVNINGQRLEIETVGGLVPLGDYPAKTIEPKHAVWGSWPRYQLLLPNGFTPTYDVSAVGESVPTH